jgi:NAD(P)H dehydrogenase (quinone)
MILVTGATGRVGYRLVEELTDARVPVTGMVRVAAKGLDLPRSAEHLVATLDDPPDPEVLRRFDAIFLMSPSRESQVELEITFVDAVVAAGHQPRVVKLAADGFQDLDCTVRFMRNHRQIAAHLGATGLPVTYLAPNLYMENLLSATEDIRERGVIPAPTGDGRVAFVAASDVAAAAARALVTGEPDAIHVLTGPEALAYGDVAARISAVFARQVDHDDIPLDQARSRMQTEHVPEWHVDGMIELFDWVRNGACDGVTEDVHVLTDERPRTLERWLNDRRGAFMGSPGAARVEHF